MNLNTQPAPTSGGLSLIQYKLAHIVVGTRERVRSELLAGLDDTHVPISFKIA